MVEIVYKRGNIIWREELDRETAQRIIDNDNYIVISVHAL